jgi:hypothetical protein
MKQLAAFLWSLVLLAGGAVAPAMAQDDPSATRRFSGVYVDGWEVQLFIEHGRENDQPYWVAMTPEARAEMARVLPQAYEPGEGVRVVTQFDGRLSRPGRYGHLGVYPHTVLIERVISARLEGRPAAYCDAEANGEWAAGAGERFAVSAMTTGPNCRQSAVVLIVRNADGDIAWTDALAANHVMGLNEPATRSPMSAALANWIGEGARGRTTADLPDWTHAAGAPSASGFEFSPEPWYDRDAYLRLRARAEPMFCYVQGMESLACLITDGERLEKIGVWSFPG